MRRISSKALVANIVLAVRVFGVGARLPLRGYLRRAHAARLTRIHGLLRRSALFQVALVAQILLPFRFVFTRSPFRARVAGAATPALQRPARLQTLSSLAFVTSSAQILPFVQLTLIPTPAGIWTHANETLPVLVLHVVVRPTRKAQVLVVAFRRPGLTEISSALLPLGAVLPDARALNPPGLFSNFLVRVVSRPVFSRERVHRDHREHSRRVRLVRGQELSTPGRCLGGGLRLHDGILVLIERPDRFLFVRTKDHQYRAK